MVSLIVLIGLATIAAVILTVVCMIYGALVGAYLDWSSDGGMKGPSYLEYITIAVLGMALGGVTSWVLIQGLTSFITP